MAVKPFLVLASFALCVAACASSPDVPARKLSADLIAADRGKCGILPGVTEARCHDAIERPIWQREAPYSFPLYAWFNHQRLALAERFDSATLSLDGTVAALAANKAELWRRVVQWDAAQAPAQAQDQAEFNADATGLALIGIAILNGLNEGRAYSAPSVTAQPAVVPSQPLAAPSYPLTPAVPISPLITAPAPALTTVPLVH